MYTIIKSRFGQVLIWFIWLLVFLVSLGSAALAQAGPPESLAIVVTCPPRPGLLFPWEPRFRWRKWALLRYHTYKQRFRQARWAYRRAVWTAHLARLALLGMIPFARVVDWLTRSQLRRQLGALPVLYPVLEILDVRSIVNRHCPQGRAKVDPGAVVLALILNRLLAPRPLYRVTAWLAQTALPAWLGLPATQFNDDRLGRTLEALAPHLRAIWLDVVHRALVHFDIDLGVLFYDLTAFICHGEYRGSDLVQFGFAHNTPMNKRKVKSGLTSVGDGGLPLDYSPWPGATADTATVQENLERLTQLLARHGYPTTGIVLVGDRATVNAELALAYEQKRQATGLCYLAGLEARQKEHRALLVAYPESYFRRHPLAQAGYYGIPAPIRFEHGEQRVTHRGLIVLSRPMQRARRRTRAAQLRTLLLELATVAAQIGQPRHRTVAQVQKRAHTCLQRSPVGSLVEAWGFEEAGRIRLRWCVDRTKLQAVMRSDGRYLLVTNHPTLTPSQMLELYRSKDACEKCFTVCKQDLRVSPVYLHRDERIQAMLLLQMLALLTYKVLERQARQHGLVWTTRRIIAALEGLTVIETHCWDGSVLVRLAALTPEQVQLLPVLDKIIAEMRWPYLQPVLGQTPSARVWHGLPPGQAPPWVRPPQLAPAA